MRLRSIFRRCWWLVGVLLGAVVVLVWIRREAAITDAPAPEFGISDLWSRSGRTGAPSDDLMINEPERRTRGIPEGSDEAVARPLRPIAPKSPLPTPDSPLHVRLNVPFVSQAPFRVWDLPYKEFCEEAAVFTMHLWKQGKRTPPADELDRSLKDIQAWEIANLRTWEDSTVDETARILREKFGYVQTWVVRGVTIEIMKEELRKGRPLVVPAAGRELSSPYYRPPGPLYHMLVIIGYDDTTREFITNDVGTNTKGAGFRFTYDDLYGAMGDWDVALGAPDTTRKVAIVVE